MKFQNKVVLITGASSGIGAAAAKLFTQEGASVVIVGRNQEKLAKVETECAALGNRPLVIRADVVNDEEAKKIIKTTIDKYGKLDVLVNNAGIARYGFVVDGSVMKSFDEVMNVNLRAAVHITSLASPHLVKTKGNVVNISSVLGSCVKGKAHVAYCVSKAALDQFTRAAAVELAAHGVRVNCISPGPVNTDIQLNSGLETNWERAIAATALNRMSEPEEVAELIVFVASDSAKGITGSNYVTDNGLMLT
ncbi:unnamed protein product [Diatraea saccharalis]|uniref:Ketoreductase domain-containing protein n=1 Tax=Diatraea saccharalis TaxID=40085 RepID=A0A9N9R8F0_9NEOP|nr:unnamed protein product [Diatraea saccharalis]